MPSIDRRAFMIASGALPLVSAGAAVSDPDEIAIADDGWRLIVDQQAAWKDDPVFLPADVQLRRLPVRAPSGGWAVLDGGIPVTLPTTVEQHFWGKFSSRPYTADEYRYADDDPVPQNGAYVGVSWWVKDIAIPVTAWARRAILTVRGARQRAEVFLNRKLVGYSMLAELPFDCDLTAAMKPGEINRLAIRITNPGGRYDWKDSGTVSWGGVKFYPGHGFGGLDRGLTLKLCPKPARIGDAWVLNTPEPNTVTGFIEVVLAKPPASLEGLKAKASAKLFDANGAPVAAQVTVQSVERRGLTLLVKMRITAPGVQTWDFDTPNLYTVRFQWFEDVTAADHRQVRFGFRWFAPEGFGTDAVLKLNGRRIKVYSAISWGYWGFNGLWPTPELAQREVEAAKALGLNCLHFHRNLGRHDVLDRQDEAGLLRVMEPGAGRMAIGPKDRALSVAEKFARDYQVARAVGMVKAFRSHPSLIQYTLQNEINGDLSNPDLEAVMRAMHEADPSRVVLLNDGFVGRGAAQAMFRPYDDAFHRSDVDQYAGWWVNHQGASDQWVDAFYKNKDDFVHRQPMREAIVEFGEMEGCAVCDNHTLDAAEILSRGGKAYDLEDHRAIIVGTNDFLQRFGFRQAFATAEALYRSIGRKSYDSWQNYLENIRIGDSVDMACISGWESTAIENHSGIVSNLRHFRTDPEIVRAALLPVRPVAKQRKLAFARGEKAVLDLYLLNDSGRAVGGTLVLSLVKPGGGEIEIGRFAAPAYVPGQFSYLLAENVTTPVLDVEGPYTIRFTLEGVPAFERQIWVADTNVPLLRAMDIAVAGISRSLHGKLEAIPGLSIGDYTGWGCDGIVASGLKADEIARRQIGEETGNEQRPAGGQRTVLVEGELPPWVLGAVQDGVPLIAIVPEDGLADGVAKQLARLGLFRYDGQVGDLRAPWMGNWNFLRAHPLHDGIPANMAAGVLHQISGQPSNGLKISGENLEVVAGYSRDHDRFVGAASFIARKNKMRVLVHRMPEMAAPLQARWWRNAVNWLAQGE
jgi:beta-galactosidase